VQNSGNPDGAGAVGPLVAVFRLGDGAWIVLSACREHEWLRRRAAFGLDSEGLWYESKKDLELRLGIYNLVAKPQNDRVIEAGRQEGWSEAEVKKRLTRHPKDIFSLAEAESLASARDAMLELGFRQIEQ
jgi:hypothetical protein